VLIVLALSGLALSGAQAAGPKKGLSDAAKAELSAAGVDKYLGTSTAAESSFGVWTKHTFDPQYTLDEDYPTGFRPDGPVCIAGTDYSVFTKEGNPEKLLIFLQGGGACWQNFYNCNVLAEDQAPPAGPPFPGVFDSGEEANPFADYSVVYMPYCDGSAFGGDNDVNDTVWQEFIEEELGLEPGQGPLTRFHRGVRNVSAGMDVARATFPDASQITVMGHSAGGVGVAAFAPFLARFAYGNDEVNLTVHNDAGPIAVNLGIPPGFPGGPTISWFSVLFRQNDWQFAQFYPQSCILDERCNAFGQQTGIIDWRLENDTDIREVFYETDSDITNRFFAQGDGTLMNPEDYRNLILAEHGALNAKYPKRYKRFIVSGDDTHGAVQVTAPTPNFPFEQPDKFYTQEATTEEVSGLLLSEWTRSFILDGGDKFEPNLWEDTVEDYVPVPFP
jgi:hypothetical protein